MAEVVVTAQKRQESIRDVPMAVSALAGDKLVETSSFRFSDYVEKLPGVTLIDNGPEGSQIVIRGISIGAAQINAPVATYLDETPFTAVGPFVGSSSEGANLDTFDLARVEVLRGPQGTLYGANALGGLLKYVTNAPQLERFAGALEAGVNSVDHGGIGGDVHGMINLPIGDKVALRIVGFDTDYAGYVDNPNLGKDINGIHNYGGRVSLLVQPSDKLSVRLNALYQRRSWSDTNQVEVQPNTFEPIYGDLVSNHRLPQPGVNTNELYNATITYDFGPVKLMSASSYGRIGDAAVIDDSSYYGPFLSALIGPAPVGVKLDDPVTFYVQEARLSSSGQGPLQWQLGGYYSNERAREFEGIFPGDTATGQLNTSFVPGLGTFIIVPTYREYAVFGDVDYHFTPSFDIQLGGRYSHNNQTFHELGSGLLAGNIDFSTVSSEGVFTYSADARWKPTSATMVYARIATGFAPGGPNDVIPGSTLPGSFESSKTTNYEVGVKSQLLNGRLTAELAAFDIEWSRIQLQAVVAGLSTITNGGSARSDGVEWSLGYEPITGLNFSFNGAYTDARLTEDGPASVNAHAGDPLAQAPRWAGTVSADYSRPLTAAITGSLGADWRWTTSRFSDFPSFGPRQELPGYGIVDLRAGVQVRNYRLDLYVRNVADKRAINSVTAYTVSGGLGVQSAIFYQPRTFGASLSATW
ncbi:MAG TPA: TonB-dependent receptor [Caulobacteraceae bacterium]|nr:TonB-dependent receptor [Caulobacteraceae bacterium]